MGSMIAGATVSGRFGGTSWRERKGLKNKTLDQKIREGVARMFAVDPTPQETDDLCDRLFHGQD
jgi:hypothetical protein